MASEVQQNYYGWQHGEISEQEDFQGQSVSQMLDHGSISFGRFALEPLSWERRSVFTYNERQAELEKFKSPGLVAKKKAYFEEYYKKIRAMKSMQENQQTELSLEYGADGSISSQTGDEDEPALPTPGLNEGPQSTSQAALEYSTIQKNFEKVCNEALEYENTETGSSEQATAIEKLEPQHSRSGITHDDSHDGSVQVQMAHGLSTGSLEVINENERNHCLKRSYMNDENPKLKNPDLALCVYTADPTSLSAVKTDFTPTEKPAHEKTKFSISKPNTSSISVPVSKEHTFSARHFSTSEDKSSLSSKHLLPQRNYKSEINIASSRTSSSKARGSDKCTSIVSDRSLTGLQRRSIAGIAAGTKGHFLPSDSVISIRSAVRKLNPKGKTQVQAVSEEKSTQITCKGGNLQNKSRNHGQSGKELVVLENKYSSLHESGVRGAQQLKTRSVNLPSRNKPGSHGFISCNSGNSAFGDKAMKVNAPSTKKYEERGSKIVTLPQRGTIKKPLTTPKNHEPSFGGRKPFSVGSSSHGKKSRQEMPIWR